MQFITFSIPGLPLMRFSEQTFQNDARYRKEEFLELRRASYCERLLYLTALLHCGDEFKIWSP